MKRASREFALSRSWDAVFEGVYDAYREAKRLREMKKAQKFEDNKKSKA
jgi:hypothetical protein